MTKSFARQILLCAVVLPLLFLCECAVPLGPGYQIEQERIEVRDQPSGPARIRIHAFYRLKNVGNRKLTAVEVALPDTKVFGRENLRAQVGGHDVSPQEASGTLSDTLRILFDRPWHRKQRRTLVIEYDLTAGAGAEREIALAENAFHLASSRWLPLLQPPEGLFAKPVARPDPTQVAVLVPEGFLVLSSGELAGEGKESGEVEHRFRLRAEDFDPFVVAGRYSERVPASGKRSIIFWTFAPSNSAATERAAARLAETMNTYRLFFGPIADKSGPVWIVETSAKLATRPPDRENPSGMSFPNGALLNQEAFALGVTSESFLELAERELARTWFGLMMELRPEVERALGEGLAEYAVIVAAEAREGQMVRRQKVAQLLAEYDQARTKAVEKPLSALGPGDPWQQLVIAEGKSPLFFLALEDQCGKQNVWHALAHLVRSLRGKQVGYAELRSALEEECNHDLAPTFRTWLDQTGIPADFRARYEAKQ